MFRVTHVINTDKMEPEGKRAGGLKTQTAKKDWLESRNFYAWIFAQKWLELKSVLDGCGSSGCALLLYANSASWITRYRNWQYIRTILVDIRCVLNIYCLIIGYVLVDALFLFYSASSSHPFIVPSWYFCKYYLVKVTRFTFQLVMT